MRLTPLVLLIAPVVAFADAPKPAATHPATTQAASTQPTTQTAAAAAAKPDPSKQNSIAKITQKDIDAITYEDAEEDTGFITPLASDLDNMDNDARKRLDDWTAKLNDWTGAKDENLPQRVRNLMSVCSLADMVHSEFEGETAYVVFDTLKSEVDKDELIKACAWITLKPEEGRCVTRIPELGWDDDADEDAIRERSALYAKKLLGRLVGKLPKKN